MSELLDALAFIALVIPATALPLAHHLLERRRT